MPANFTQNLLLFLYLLPLSFIFLYSLVQLSLVIYYLRRKAVQPVPIKIYEELPFVTIQLPLYNEKYVVERLLQQIAKIDYPNDKLEIQILDDSTDETVGLIEAQLKQWETDANPAVKQRAACFQHIRRRHRKGYKAGALAYGLSIAKGEFIAIFDADFLPPTTFLYDTLGHFTDPAVGVVQTRWGHLNENESLLTKLQAFGLNAHFHIEQGGRHAAKHFINFNGTGGIWRRKTIETAGGWQADTLTEDLDLSYRAQAQGWKFVYREDIETPAELPVAIAAVKSQQYRWMKGGAECFKKNAVMLIAASHVRISDKLHGFFHLLNSSLFVAILAISLLSVPLFFVTQSDSQLYRFYQISAFFQVNWLILGVFYWLSFQKSGQSLGQFVYRFFWFLTLMLGLSLHNAVAVIEAWIGRRTPFVRTPKFGSVARQQNSYVNPAATWFTAIEAALSILFFGMMLLDIAYGNVGLVLFHGMLALGYGSIVYWTLRHS